MLSQIRGGKIRRELFAELVGYGHSLAAPSQQENDAKHWRQQQDVPQRLGRRDPVNRAGDAGG